MGWDGTQPANFIHLFSLAVTRFSLSRLQHHSGAPSYFSGPLGSRLKGPLTSKGTRGSFSADFDGTLDFDDDNFFFF